MRTLFAAILVTGLLVTAWSVPAVRSDGLTVTTAVSRQPSTAGTPGGEAGEPDRARPALLPRWPHPRGPSARARQPALSPGQPGIVPRDADVSARSGEGRNRQADASLAWADRRAAPSAVPEPLEPVMRTSEGFDVVPGTAEAGDGPTLTYTVEVEPAVDEDLAMVAATVEAALHDRRSWATDRTLRRVDDPGDAEVRVLLATPETVDELCGAVGLQTAGRFSCWTGTFAALNAMRWREGADAFDDLTAYRYYLVNHEVGHGLGAGHRSCPGSGDLAPVMMQQTIGTGGCVANSWPYPEVRSGSG